MKKKSGWPKCGHCELFNISTGKCKAVNEENLSPCECMSKKAFKYLMREE
jgi:hypothetical protein